MTDNTPSLYCYQLDSGKLAHMVGGKFLIVGTEDELAVMAGSTLRVVPVPEDNEDPRASVKMWLTNDFQNPVFHSLSAQQGWCTSKGDDNNSFIVHDEWCNKHHKWEHLWRTSDVHTGDNV